MIGAADPPARAAPGRAPPLRGARRWRRLGPDQRGGQRGGRHAMDKQDRETLAMLRGLPPAEAADWIIAAFPQGARWTRNPARLLAHHSWAKADHVRLAEHFLGELPHASGQYYAALLSFMSLPRFLRCVQARVPEDAARRDLLAYYLRPLLLAHPGYATHRAEVHGFLAGLG